jgi:hypothetical protein
MKTVQKSASPSGDTATSTMTENLAAQPADQDPSLGLSKVVETILASPEFRKSARFDDFLVSPSLSPCDDFNMSPMDDSPMTPNLDTPIMNDLSDDFGMYATEYGGIPLFNDGAMSMYQLLESQEVAQAQTYELSKLAPESADSPLLPAFGAVSPTSLAKDSLPTVSTSRSASPASSIPKPPRKKTAGRGRKVTATGTRKNITPESLVPVDAPIQNRKYVTSSATSRKELPAAFLKSQKRKRSRAQAFGDEEAAQIQLQAESSPFHTAGSPEVEEHPPLNATDKELIEWKRRQNTLAARKSRKRKLEHQQFLESRVKDLESENEMLKVRAEALEAALRVHNILLPKED